ncbi:MAG: MFS transporter [Defluviitaleaceae bacterium]|nr:MFS transporter [Defluviitaleaceae bacterium]
MSVGNKRYIYVAAATLMLLLAGIIYAWSILNAPFQAEFGWSQGALGLNFTLTMGAFCAGLIWGGYLLKRIPLRKILISAGILVCIGFSVTGTMSGNSILVLYIAYAIFCGLGIGVVYNALISSIMGWFPDKRATVSGILMMGFGASTLVFGFIANAIMNAIGWRNMYIGIGVTILVVFTICSFLIKAYVPPSKPPEAKDKGLDKIQENVQSKPKDYNTSELLRLPSFWRFYGFETLIAAVGACVIAMARDMAVYVGTTESLAVILVGVSSVSNGFGRIVAGVLFDKKGSLTTMRTVGIIALLTPLLMLLSGWTSRTIWFVPGIMLAGFSYGFTPVLASGFMGKNYGMKNFPMNFSIVSTFLFVASFSATIGGWLHGVFGGFNAVFIFMGILGALGIVMAETLRTCGQ